ncbi:MAG TPA: HAMP domain-containing sensor histidine kinase [Planctomycetota bacterium]|nr:HAMP domain-containing sensor histidine kinase [Planctomycetota bacterium]
MAALSFLLWRTLQLEARARQVERERAELVAERILRAAVASHAALEQVPAALRFVMRGDRVEVDDSVGWLPTGPRPEPDLVVQDRLERAARAEFAEHDAAAATRQFDELLQQPLPTAQRLEVLAAAAWFHERAGHGAQVAPLRDELDSRIGELEPAQLGDAGIANAVAAALRLPRGAGEPAWAGRFVPLLPSPVHAGLPTALQRPQAAAAVAARRDLLEAVQREWLGLPSKPDAALVAVGQESLLWWLPRDDGGRDGARLSIGEWLAAVRAAGSAGELPEWPWLVDAVVARDAGESFAGVPRLSGLRPSVAASVGESPWLLPVLTLVLLLAFGLAAWLQFRASRREAAAVRAQAEFLTTVTHELKTPLASIRLLGEMLAEGRAAGREPEYYKMLAGEAGRLSVLIENVLDLGRLERGERAYDLRPVDVGAVVGETMALFAPVGEREGLRVELHDRLATPATVRLDRGAFVQAFVCVLDNARKYGGAGARIDVETRSEGERVHVEVRDHGPGVPEVERQRIFERFVRGTAHAHGGTPGVGIGLYLARTIARRLGGELVCTAPLDGDHGACFTFTFPMETPA